MYGMAERITENLVRDQLRDLGYNNPDNGISIEEQKSEIARIKTLLSKASKNSKGVKQRVKLSGNLNESAIFAAKFWDRAFAVGMGTMEASKGFFTACMVEEMMQSASPERKAQ